MYIARRIGEMEVYFHNALTSVLDGAEWKTSGQSSFTSRERADY
jgi:hypothetical protein